jgi:hypothetical protein
MVKESKKKQKSRTIYYFRCGFKKSKDYTARFTLQEMVADSWSKLPTTAERTFAASNDKTLVGMYLRADTAKLRRGNESCLLFSVGLYEEGAAANTIFKPTNLQSELKADTLDAPNQQEYLDGKAFVCICDNHIVLSPTSSLRAGTVQNFIGSLLHKGGFDQAALLMDIQQVADIDVYKTIQTEGIKNITINASAYLSSLDYIERNNPDFKPSSIVGKISRVVKSLIDSLHEDDTDESIVDNENLNAKIVYSHDGRATNSRSVAIAAQMEKTATTLVSNSDLNGYVIITKEGKKLTHEEIVLKNTVKVTEHGKTVRREEILAKLVNTLERYDKDGLLEQ